MECMDLEGSIYWSIIVLFIHSFVAKGQKKDQLYSWSFDISMGLELSQSHTFES